MSPSSGCPPSGRTAPRTWSRPGSRGTARSSPSGPSRAPRRSATCAATPRRCSPSAMPRTTSTSACSRPGPAWPTTVEPLTPAFVAKYAARIAALDLTPEQFAATYAQTIRLVPIKALGWHGRSRPMSVVAAARRVAEHRPVSIMEPLRADPARADRRTPGERGRDGLTDSRARPRRRGPRERPSGRTHRTAPGRRRPGRRPDRPRPRSRGRGGSASAAARRASGPRRSSVEGARGDGRPGQGLGEVEALPEGAARGRACGPPARPSRCPRRRSRCSSERPMATMAPARAAVRASLVGDLDELAGDLEDVDRELAQVAEREVAGPEVVDDDADAELAQRPRGSRSSRASP